MKINNVYSFPVLFTSLLLLLLGVAVFLKNTKKRVNLQFLIICLTSSIWLFFTSLAYNSLSQIQSFLLFRIAYIGIIFIPFTFFHYIVLFLEVNKKQLYRFVVRLGYGVGTLFSVLSLFSSLVISRSGEFFWGWYPIKGVLHPLLLFFFFSYIIFGIALLICSLMAFNDLFLNAKRIQIRYILLGLFIFNFASLDFLANYELNVYPFGYIPTLLFLIIIGYAIVRYHLMEIKVTITRAGIFVILYSLVLGFPFYIAYHYGKFLLSLFIMFIFASAGPIGFRYLKGKADTILLAEQRRYQRILLHAAQGLARQYNLVKLLKLIVYMLRSTVGISFVAIYIFDKETRCYDLRVKRGVIPEGTVRLLSEEEPIILFLEKVALATFFEELPASIQQILPLGSSLLVPLILEKHLLGFLLLGQKKNRQNYTTDDLNVFNIVSSQTALAVENCFYIEDFKKAQERLFAAEKLSSIGGMAEGLAHQMKNRLNHFSVAAGEQQMEIEEFVKTHAEIVTHYPELQKTLDYLMETSKSIVSNVRKTSDVVQGILNFAHIEQKEHFFSVFSLKEVAVQAVEVLKMKHHVKEFPLKVNSDCSDEIYGVKSQIIECLFNLLDNAYEAINDKREYHLSESERASFVYEIIVNIRHRNGHSSIEIHDNGIGIKDENKRKIFAPFFTTKSSYKSGSGIGMYIVKRIIEENHKGSIRFDSTYGKGTIVYIELPEKV
jgi:signal transduction histidine kinase